jgi:hypothetical protein
MDENVPGYSPREKKVQSPVWRDCTLVQTVTVIASGTQRHEAISNTMTRIASSGFRRYRASTLLAITGNIMWVRFAVVE